MKIPDCSGSNLSFLFERDLISQVLLALTICADASEMANKLAMILKSLLNKGTAFIVKNQWLING